MTHQATDTTAVRDLHLKREDVSRPTDIPGRGIAIASVKGYYNTAEDFCMRL